MVVIVGLLIALQARYGYCISISGLGSMIETYANNKLERNLFFNVEEQVSFTLYTRDGPKDGQRILLNTESLKQSDFATSKHTKLITHGFRSSGKSDTCQQIKDNYILYQDVNVVIMDWEEIAGNLNYFAPATSTRDVGAYYGRFLDLLVSSGADPDKIHLVGHSLGAHVSGFASELCKSNISRVTGLDPAFPVFGTIQLVGGRISPTVAKFVDIIHTSRGVFGLMDPVGHCDFYPNGGTQTQPGCDPINDITEACSHGMSWRLFKESIDPNIFFKSYNSRSYEDFQKNIVSGSARMGEYVSMETRGMYYLRTSANPPYLFSVDKKHRFF